MMNWPLLPCRTDSTTPTWLTCLHVWLSPTYPSRSKLPSGWLTSWQQAASFGSQTTDSQPHRHHLAGTLPDVPPLPSPWRILVNYSSSTITCSAKCPFPSQQTDLAFSIIILYTRNYLWQLLIILSTVYLMHLYWAPTKYQENIYFCFIHHTKAFHCVDHSKPENSERDGNTRPLDLPLEKPVYRSGSNS